MLLGVAIALVLELSGVPSLPFAVGVYLPLSSSTPIFVGGLVRYLADRTGRAASGNAASEAESEMELRRAACPPATSPAAPSAACWSRSWRSATRSRQLTTWQYRHTAIAEAKPLQEQFEDAAAVELGLKTPERPTTRAPATDRRPGR